MSIVKEPARRSLLLPWDDQKDEEGREVNGDRGGRRDDGAPPLRREDDDDDNDKNKDNDDGDDDGSPTIEAISV